MRRTSLTSLSVGLLLLLTVGARASAPVMAVPGQANVSSAGTFGYSIPIVVPPGTNGMVPSLSLDYSSASTDGVEGWGWSLDGLDSMERCARTLTLDGVHGSVNYDINDRFCLNGQRLMLASGTYGADGSTYRTFVDTYSKIIAHGQTYQGTVATGPQWFEIHTKSGVVLQLGNTADSAIQAVGKNTIREWLVNREIDTSGNYFAVTYKNDQDNGQAYPTRIDYTGNDGVGLTPYSSVSFVYATRSDIVPTYQAGSLQQYTKLLSDIKTYAGSTEVFDYKLAYRAGTSTLHSRLISVTQCDSSESTCLVPTTFDWQGGQDLTAMSGTSNSIAHGFGLLSGDFNADGLTDALVLDPSCPSGGVIYSGSNAGTFTRAGMTTSYDYWLDNPPPYTVTSYSGSACFLATSIQLGDINADGFTDGLQNSARWVKVPIMPDYINEPFSNALLNNKTGALDQGTFSTLLSPPMAIVGDFNGDGRSDGLSGDTVYLSNGDTTFTIDGDIGLTGTLVVGDFDGDGCADALEYNAANEIKYFCQPAVATAPTSILANAQLYVGDFNGDLSTDVLAVFGAQAELFLSTGTGLDSGHFIPNSSWYNHQIVEGDWNGDGKADIAVMSNTPGNPDVVYVSTGTGFIQTLTIPDAVSTSTAVAADWNNDGVSDLWIKSTTDKLYKSVFGSDSYAPERIVAVHNGLGATTTIAYDRLNKNGTFFTKSTGAVYPYQDADGPSYVVSSLTVSNGVGGSNMTTYIYAGLKINVSDPPKKNTLPTGFLTFASITSTNPEGIVTKTNYITPPNDPGDLAGLAKVGLVATQTVKSGSTTLRSITNSYNAAAETGGSYAVTLTETDVAQTDLSGTAFPSVDTTYTYDAYGNPLTVSRSVSDGSSQSTTNTYTNDTTNWILGQILTSNTHSIVGSSNLTRHLSFSHDAATGLITQQIVEPSATDNRYLKSVYGYDAYGNRNSTTTSAYSPSFGATRTNTVVYDNKGQFVVRTTNALNQSATWGSPATPGYDARFGLPTGRTDANGLITRWAYDTFGRISVQVRPDGNRTAWTYTLLSNSHYPNIAFYSDAVPYAADGTTQNGAGVRGYYDSLSRTVISATQGFGGNWIFAYTQYDALGRVGQQSRPYFYTSGATQPQSNAKFTVYTHDILARVTKATYPDTSFTTYTYDALTTSQTNSKSQTTVAVANAQGLTESVTDANGKTTSYAYDAFGDLTAVTDPLGNKVTNTYDIRGRKTASHDPDMGSWSYGYDAFAELTSQTDAKSQTTTLTYDLLGRPTQRVEADLTSNWVYDTAAHGIGMLASACTGTGCSSPSNASYFRQQSYDTLGRPAGTTLTIGGASYVYTNSYNSDGRPDTVAYPSSFVAKYVYQATYGYLTQIKDGPSGTAYWTANARDAELHLTQATLGNGVVETNSFDGNTGLVSAIQAGPSNAVANYAYAWDTIGNLTSRQDVVEGYTESFCYDSLNRLTNYALGASCTASGTKTIAYDDLGNVTSKSGVGTYSYPTPGASSVRPHAVTGITGTVNGVVNPTYAYDANGNMTSGGGRTIVPTSFNMAASVAQGGNTFCLAYDSEHNRIAQVQTTATCSAPDSGASTTTYINDPASGGMEELFSSASSGIVFKDYILAEGQIVAQRSVVASNPPVWGDAVATKWGSFTWTARPAPTVLYVVGDHLGSTSVLTDPSGAVTERDSYDAWGKRRNADGTDAVSCTAITSQMTRGFTEQEHLDPACAINFNARMYDPTIARFLSADSIVPNPLNGQGFNRYSYVNNGPLSAIDPSGHVLSGICTASSPCDKLLSGGPPCFGCSGPMYDFDSGGAIFAGGQAGGNGGGYVISANGQHTMCYTDDCLNGSLNQIISNNSAHGYDTRLIQSYPGASSVDYFHALGAPLSTTFDGMVGGVEQVTFTGNPNAYANDTNGGAPNSSLFWGTPGTVSGSAPLDNAASSAFQFLKNHVGLETHGGDVWAYSASADKQGWFVGFGGGFGEFSALDVAEQVPLVETSSGNPYGLALQVNVSASLRELGLPVSIGGINIPAGISSTFYFSFSNFGSYEATVQATGPSLGPASGTITFGERARW
ncbi:MAG TPA: FG-GAP-like repeat-containing protein [Rhizomicrobium sp.]